ncbi:hypothetical protein V1639_10715 [Pseudarthrobacter sp. J75]|uniref:hyaluronate lyase N-terminal domain-containing protein n=1 Tax=unclassified Pseudarthrobacter TaxID=2647000 RepID=UPI002E80247D|nr:MULTISPECIES: hypothetical protein [unclassified Pseudarthrobacter]MEE2522633.1 hypothetical protein [Pseudarthrobacter sp. J47]MEE2529494.1 hypothetical protein [Pseudarthrobacter sp. J75]
MAQRIQLRRGPAAQWAEVNPVLGQGEPGVESDTGKLKLGDGVTAWAALAYASAGPQGPAGVADDTSVADLVTTPGTETAKALSATILDKVENDGASFFAGVNDFEVSAAKFGLTGVGDETVKFQEFIDYLAANKKIGVLPHAAYTLSADIDFPGVEGFGIRGMGRASTTIWQTTDNIPIFRLGTGATETPNTAGFRMWSIKDMGFRYTNNRPATNTNAIPLLFVAMAYQFRMEGLFFYNGYYGWKVTPGQVVPWGFTADDLYFNKHITGGAIDWTGVINNGPNINFGRIFVEANTMTGPIFILRGHAAWWPPLKSSGLCSAPSSSSSPLRPGTPSALSSLSGPPTRRRRS